MQKIVPAIIKATLGDKLVQRIQRVDYLELVESTNCYLEQFVHNLDGIVICLAEQQTAGQAQHGRSWVSPYGCNMYLSVLWPFTIPKRELAGLSLAISVAIVKALTAYGIAPSALQLKWPNDVYGNGKKLCGILCHSYPKQNQFIPCIIGVGLNIAMPNDLEIDQPFTDVQTLMLRTPNRNQIIGLCIKEIMLASEEYTQSGLRPFLTEFHQHDYLKDKPIALQLGEQLITGIAQGIDHEGHLLVKTEQGHIKRFASGKASILKQ